ncbi:Macrolide export ATP-binding/permease protein MacB [Anaerolineales bacterium]|nr:Macrolide export ATP-binding/permease protein MacB [Anaerolineales bacterium]
MGVLWFKIWFDLWHNKTRTLLAVFSIAAGVYAVGAIFGMSDLLTTKLNKSHHAVLPTHVNVMLENVVDRETLLSLKDVEGVEDIEPYNSVSIFYKLRPEDDWRPGVIQMRDDFENQKYELLQLREGHWPDVKNEVAVERMAAQFLDIGIGDSVIFKIDEKERNVPVTGLVRHPFVPPPQFQDLAFFFMSSKGMERLDIPEGKFSSFYVRVTPYSADYAKEVASAIKSKLAKQDIRVAAFVYEDPNKHWGSAFFDGITLVQKLLALICVIISAVLVYNTLSNLITQQINQIGILKAIGGRTRTIITMYLFSALVYGILALVVALPLGAVTASKITVVFLGLFNIDAPPFEVSREAIIYQVMSALLAPLLAGLPPVLQGAGITVRQAIASYGLGGDFHSSWFDLFIERVGRRWLPSHYATALGNMFRHKGRLLLTQLVLIAAGSAFLMVQSMESSISLTLDNFFARQDYETMIQFDHNEKASRVQEIANRVEGVEEIELQLVPSASMYVSGQLIKDAGIGTYIKGIPEGSDFFKPLIVSGRWITSGEGRVVVLSRETAKKNKIKVGDMVTIDLGTMGRDEWQVIGLYEPVFVGNFVIDTIYAPQEALYKTTKKYNQGTVLLIRTTSTDGKFTDKVTRELKELYEKNNMKVMDSMTQAAQRETNEWQFSTVTWMLLALSIIVAVVGAIALMGALSIGVIERTKEIGVLRAVGARSHTILGIFVMEGVLQGLLSWLVAVPISLVTSPIVAKSLGIAMFGATLDYQYNWAAIGVWFGIIIVISVLASILPARGATQISVRDNLAYA